MLAIREGNSLFTEIGHHFFEGGARTIGVGAYSQLIHIVCKWRLGLQGDDATKSGLRNHGDLQNRRLHSLCRVNVEQLS